LRCLNGTTLRGCVAESLIEAAFANAAKLKDGIITVEIVSHLYPSICGIEANIRIGPESSISSVRN
jgi:hypothetical protein